MNGCGGGHIPSLYQWQEVTTSFLPACSQLELGELLHDEMFGLFEAMSAIEMMDPKMDAGMICNRSSNTPLSFDEAVASGHVVLSKGELTWADMVGIIDECLSCLVTWLEGHSLAQTVFTCLYLHQVDRIEDPILRSALTTLLRLVEVIKDLVGKAGVYEEEDFQPLTYGFRLCSEVGEQKCIGQCKEAEEILAKEVRRTKPREGAERSAEDDLQHFLAAAVCARLKLLRLLYSGLAAIHRGQPEEGGKMVAVTAELLPGIASSLERGTHAVEGSNMIGFEPLANQRLLPPTFPRYTEIVGRAEAVSYLSGLVGRLGVVCSLPLNAAFHSTLDFFQSFSATSPCVLSRSVLQLLYTPLHTPLSPHRPPPLSPPAGPPLPPSFPDLLRESCKSFMAAPALLSPPRPSSPLHTLQVKLCLDTFFSQCCRPFGLLLQATGHNRARQRDKIALLLEEFSTVQEEADRIDSMLNTISVSSEGASGKPHSLFLGTWLLYHVLKLMVRYVLSGFELELYSVHEWRMVFWYLYELLYPWLINCLHRADSLLAEHIENQDKEKARAGKSKKKTKASAKKPKLRPYLAEIASYQAHAHMCAGYYKMLVGLRTEGKTVVPNPQFDNEPVRYEHRFGAFAALLTPPLMPYSQYKEVLEHTQRAPVATLYSTASKDFGQARQILETMQATVPDDEVATLITINKTNFVVASVLARDSKRNIDFDFSLHQNFPTAKLV